MIANPNNLEVSESKFPVWTYESRITKNAWATTNVAVVYSYMLARYRWHAQNKRKFFESYEYIASATNVGIRTVKAAVKLLWEHGYLTYTQQKSRVGKNNIYEVKNIHGTWAPSLTDFPDGRSVSAKDKIEKRQLKLSKLIPDDDIDDGPF